MIELTKPGLHGIDCLQKFLPSAHQVLISVIAETTWCKRCQVGNGFGGFLDCSLQARQDVTLLQGYFSNNCSPFTIELNQALFSIFLIKRHHQIVAK